MIRSRHCFPVARPDTITRRNLTLVNQLRVKYRQPPFTHEEAQAAADELLGYTASGGSRAKVRHVARAWRLMFTAQHKEAV